MSLMDEWNENCETITTKALIALCEVLEDYQSFSEDLEKLIKSKTDKDLSMDAYNAMRGKKFIGSRKYKPFIEKHQKTIDVMSKYNCLDSFTILSYNTKGEKFKDLEEDYFYNYLLEHKDDIDKIKAVTMKIEKLGFDTIDFGKELDFTKVEYQINTFYRRDLYFLENIEINPTYSNSIIKYKTMDSCYCMYLDTSGCNYDNTLRISKYGRNIKLNSLLFDPDRLPDEISIATTLDVITKAAEKKQEEHQDLKDSIDLSISTKDLTDQFEYLKQVSNQIDKVKNNQELTNLLNQMQTTLVRLQLFETNFGRQVVDSHQSITKEMMVKEKTQEEHRRSIASIID